MQREKADKIERFRRLNTFVKKGQIVFAGSSLMEQFPICEFLMDFDRPYTIYNRGVGGFTTTEMLPVLKETVYDLTPKYLFLNISTNDLNAGITDGKGNLKAEYTIEGMHMYATGCKPVLDALLPTRKSL